MPTYLYECKDHGKINVIKRMGLADEPEPCDDCNLPMKKLVNFQGEVMGATDKEPEYNHAFGKVIKNSQDLRNELTKIEGETGKTLVEVGNESLNSIKKPRKSINIEEATRELRHRIRHG